MKKITFLLIFLSIILAGCSSSATTDAILEVQTYTLEEIAQHSSSDSCYTTIDGKVYDLTTWIAIHPGGNEAILSICGIDGTEKFTQKHGSNGAAKNKLFLFYIGDLVP